MSKDDKRASGRKGAPETREARLKAALKANMAKRKAQRKARAEGDTDGQDRR